MAESNHFALYFERYLKTLLQQGKSEHTVSAYRRDLSELMRLLPDNLENGLPTRRDFCGGIEKAVAKGLERKQLGAEIVGVAAILQLAGADRSHGKQPDI